jgi:CO/xanthine dehydrogenase Mo-binding subunit
MPNQTLTTIGKRVGRLNGPDIVTGQTLYADDIQLSNMLHGRILRSPHAHALIRSIDVRKARKLPGVVDVITAEDTDGLTILARKEVRYQGDKVAVVVAEDPDIAIDALELIKVDYQVLGSTTDPLAGIAPNAPVSVRGAKNLDVRDENGKRYRNVADRSEIVLGDVDAAFAKADAIVENEYRTPYWHQTYLEPNSCTARAEPDGRITLWTSCQGSFNIRSAVADALKIGEGRLRVVPLEMGGGFGAKNRLFCEAQAVLASIRTGRPVKILINREEEFLDGHPAPGCWVRLKTAASKDGTITAVEGRILWDGGIGGRNGSLPRLIGPYKVANVRLEGFGVRTNKPTPGAYRAPGAPQTALARESNIDALAHKLGIDPIDFRLKNAVRKGDRTQSGVTLAHDWFADTMRAAAKAAKWGKSRLKKNQGMGIACGDWQNGSGPSNAFIALSGDGSVQVLTGQVDITGLHTVMAQIVAEVLTVPVGKVTVKLGDTDKVPYTSLSAGSKATYTAGTAARQAAEKARERLLTEAADMLEASPADLQLKGGKVSVIGLPGRYVSVSDVATSAMNSNDGPVTGQWIVGKIPTYPSYSVNIATVEVDPGTGRVHLIDLVAAQDVGRALNPMLVEGQIQGGATQSIAYGIMEGMIYDKEGRVRNANLLDYAIPTAPDMPNIRTVLVEEGCEHGPYGAKGVGEPPIIPGAAAIANALFDAVGVRVTEIPMTPERVLTALQQARED